MKKRKKLSKEKAIIACKLIGKDFNDYKIQEGSYYRIRLTDEEFEKVNAIYNDLCRIDGQHVVAKDEKEEDEEYQKYLELKNAETKIFEYVDTKDDSVKRYAVALFSDVHIEERVDSSSVLGLNEYNVDIAKKRIEKYFKSLSSCLQKDEVETLYFACLGDIINGYLRDENMQENQMSPMQAVQFSQSLIVSGLAYLRKSNPNLTIWFIASYGNHSRSSKKIQSNGFKLSYEWLMYNNIKSVCDFNKLNVNFVIPESSMALVTAPDNRKFIFIHGHELRCSGTNTVVGIFAGLQRLAMKWDRTFHQDKIYLGHFHQVTNISTAMVNGSIIGYNAFAMSNAFAYERPCQAYDLYDHKLGNILSRKIYCDID